jgi:hypothetical protein
MVIEGDYTEHDWYGEVRVDGQPLDPRPSQLVWNHSPDGFAWGYAGSGPSQLALAILLAAGLPKRLAIALHHRFKAAFLQSLPRAGFRIDVDVEGWARENTLTAAVPTEDTP